MDEQLRHIIRHLYGEEAAVPLDDLLQDDDVRAEYEALRAVKRRLDQRPAVRPPAEVVDRVVAAADPAQADSAQAVRARADRPPKARAGGSRRRVWQALAVTCTIVIGVVAVFTQIDVTPSSPYAAEAEQAAPAGEQAARGESADTAPAPSEARAPAAEKMDDRASSGAPGPADTGAPALADRRAAAEEDAGGIAEAAEPVSEARVGRAATPAPSETLAWDEGDAVQRLHRRIELLEARSAETAWDDPAVMSLDALPGQPAPSRFDRGLNTVREQRPSTGDQ